MATFATVMTFLYFSSEALALIPSIKANSTFELVFNIIKKVSGKS